MGSGRPAAMRVAVVARPVAVVDGAAVLAEAVVRVRRRAVVVVEEVAAEAAVGAAE